MKLRNSLWAFALVFAAVSCSDDMDDPNKGGTGNDPEAKGGHDRQYRNRWRFFHD